ncbi:MAG: hypothetical protein IE916_00130 [Epsilonproteobacteria bacterium]|nr:hypothetical protein [Campylobacterota bacterium]
MPTYVKKRGIEEYISYFHKYKAIQYAGVFKNEMAYRVTWILPAFFIISPALFFMAVFATIMFYTTKFHKEFFSDKRKLTRYEGVLAPKSSNDVVAVIGYQIGEDEVAEHIQLARRDDKEGRKKLMEKQIANERWENKFKHIGISRDLATTHFVINGKTGSGKTEMIRSIANDACLAIGGGFLHNDGKSDSKLLREFVTQAQKLGRETSVSVMNFLKPELNAESNTFSPLHIMHPLKTVEFLGGLTGGGESSDGNAAYFFNQGKALLAPIIMLTYLRNKYFDEGYNLELIFNNTKLENQIILRNIGYCMCRDINDMILASPKLKAMISTVTIAAEDDNLYALSALIEYMTQHATKVKEVKEETGIEYYEIKEIYLAGYYLINAYLSRAWNQFSSLLDITARVLYIVGKEEGFSFFGEGAAKIGDIKLMMKTIRTGTEGEEAIKEFREAYRLPEYGITNADLAQLYNALHRQPQQGGNIDSPPADAVQQIAYAIQQWASLANVFTMYKHIFGQTDPEIKPEKLIKDNRFLYVLLPPLELSPDIVEILGKILIKTVQEVAAIALLGEQISMHKTLGNIYKDRLTPKPFTFAVFDEYGAYPVELSVLLAQLRSLSISVALGVQDHASLKVKGESQTSLERALANTTKIITKTEDKETIEWVKSMLSDVNIESTKMQRDMHGDWVSTVDAEITEKKSFEPETLRDFGNGFSLVMLGSKEEDLVFMQSFYRGGSPETIFIKRYLNLKFT